MTTAELDHSAVVSDALYDLHRQIMRDFVSLDFAKRLVRLLRFDNEALSRNNVEAPNLLGGFTLAPMQRLGSILRAGSRGGPPVSPHIHTAVSILGEIKRIPMIQ
jgi:hypothetical protein